MLRMSFKKTDNAILKYFESKKIPAKVERINLSDGQLRYLKTGNENATEALLFVHGAPGGLDMFSTTMTDPALQDSFLIFSVDRPGYGDSFTDKNNWELKVQVDAIIQLMDRYNQKKFVVFGHSFGGPIVGLIAQRRPALVRRIILAGAAVDPEEERFVGLARIANILSFAASSDTKAASREKIHHSAELEKIESIWSTLNCETVVMHGTSDWLVPYGNFEFLKERINKEYFIDNTMAGESHFFIGDSVLLSKAIMRQE